MFEELLHNWDNFENDNGENFHEMSMKKGKIVSMYFQKYRHYPSPDLLEQMYKDWIEKIDKEKNSNSGISGK